ncbi:ribonuclease HII [Plebeiibacterium sediminum]|uniref:Ribonuclease HII n=1 Tax=Plebeiibacterium sediminum TaxID=2992112 RepID=A0AAE3SEF5_9BACT|nr:ribonuclease HII [Plebeiobacterium sediminum]MCW3785043.1 ribonuclease HII [Plebeiobacterium sediminum]
MKFKLQEYLHKDKIEAGCDEAGRGCLAGPVVAAAVILPRGFQHPLLNDSKQLTEKQRQKLRPIIEQEAIAWAVSIVDNNEVDEINVLNASITGMQRAVENLNEKPEHLLIDGNKFKPYKDILHTCIVKGDAKFMNIAAASILAKTHRDELMENYATEFPGYDWEKNKGYPTKAHRAAIEKLGITPLHRQSFKLLDTQLKLEL